MKKTKGSRKERFEQVYRSFEPLRSAKGETIHALAGYGKKYRVLRYPILAFLFVFLFLYNAILYTLIHFRVNEKPAKAISGLLVICLVVNSIYIPSLAFDGSQGNGQNEVVCENHTAHDESCGYVEAVEGQPCAHEHGEECYITDTTCVHVHDENCYETVSVLTCGLEESSVQAEAADDAEGAEVVNRGHVHTEACYSLVQNQVCTHICSEESGCITRILNCRHTHDESCGYVEAVEGQPCMHSCASCDGSEESEPEATPEASPESTPEPLPETTPEELPEATPETEEAVEEDEEDIEKLPEEEAFEQSVVRDGVEISVSAPAGVFPAGTLLCVEMITNESDVSEIEQLVTEKKDETTGNGVVTVVERSYSFDITIVDEEGNEVEPDITRGQVSVTFKNVGVIEAEQQNNKELSVFYVTDDYAEAEEISHDADMAEDSASITAQHFSIYTVVITSGEKKNTILHYYQGTSKEASYFTIYNEEQLLRYRDLLNGYVAGTVTPDDTFSTILVNSDDSNPMDGITGLGQATNMTVRDLNFNVKIMDDITVQSTWSPITKLPAGVTFDGAGHQITFKSLAVGVTFDGTDCTVLVMQNDGTVKHVTLVYGDASYTVAGETETGLYATVTVRVDGQKAEIGEAITGAEALAASCDGVNYITLERSDDLSVYRTELENLEEDKTYYVYYVYEDENETISAAVLTKEDYDAQLNYVSVTYDLEGANTYKLVNGQLSENVMAAIRVDVLENGSCEAQEDYEAVVKAATGYEIPTRETNVTVSVGGTELVRGTDYTYTYDADTKLGTIHISRDKITGPVSVKVKADSLEDNPPNIVILRTRGGSISDPLWEKTETSTYVLNAYEDIQLPASVSSYKGSDAIRFAGWYTDMGCTGTPVDIHTYVESGGTTTYYAKWVLNKPSSENSSVYYEYKGGRLEVQGRPNNNDSGQVTFGYGGFQHCYNIGSLSANQMNGNVGGTNISMVSGVGNDAFVRIPGTNIWVAMVCTLEGSLVDITYIFENRGSSTFSTGLYFGTSADVEIADDDGATIAETPTSGGVTYMSMTSRAGTTHPNKQFRLYTRGTDFGIDAFYSYWYGAYGSQANKVFTNSGRQTEVSDSALAFSWFVNNIPAGGYVTKTTKMGLADVSTMSNITATLDANDGLFADGKSVKKDDDVTSNKQKITVNADGTLTVEKTSGNITVQPPTRIGYKFDHWSVGAAGGVSCAGKTFTESVTLYANWIPQPDRSVTNNCSVQKVNGSSNLLVPEALANIVIENTTPAATTAKIYQGQTATEAAGYASGFSCILSMEGEDDRYLLPDNIEVTITDENGVVTQLTKDTGYTYGVYDNRRKAFLEIRKQYINGDVTITVVGYELPPVTATEVSVIVPNDTVCYGDRAVFTANAETSKNHVASYQWYIAPYYPNPLDSTSWTYQNQNGIPLTNGTYVCEALNSSGNPVTVTGANKATLRIGGLDVSTFVSPTPGESMDGLRFGGYHVYCVVTSTRNITGQEIVAVSDTAELQVVTAQYAAPDGIEGSATTYYGSPDGSIAIAPEDSRPTLLYKKSTDSSWIQVTDAQLEAGEITGLSAGIYEFKYKADSNHTESAITRVEVENGRYIVVTYRAPGCNDTSLRTQYKHVAYGSNVTASTPGLAAGDTAIVNPVRTGYTFAGWDAATITGITADTTVNAVYNYGIYAITLDNQGATTAGTIAIYEKYSTGFYKDAACTSPVTGAVGIAVPVKDGYNFLGYYTTADGGTRMINADGCLSGNMSATQYLTNGTLYAHWEEKPVDFNVLPDVDNPSGDTPGGDTPGTDPDNGVEISVKPSDPVDPDDPGTGGEDPGYHAETSYDVTVTNNTGKEANVIYIYSDGVLKRTLTDVVFDENNQYTFRLVPSEVGGGTITFVVGYVSPVTEEGEEKTDEEIGREAEEQAADLNYVITYKEVNGTLTGTAFSGTFLNTAPALGVKGVATALPEATRTGYTFGGWYTAPRGTGRAVTEIPASNTADEVVVYAKWIANKYSVTLQLNGGTYADGYTPAEQYQHGGSNIALPTDTQIIKENYVFLGWFDNAELTGDAVTEVDASQVGGVTYYAGWELLPSHVITLTDDGVDGQQYLLSGIEGYGYIKDGIIYVYDKKEYQFTISVAPAYKLKAVKANGKLLTGVDGVYTIPSVTDDLTITVTTEELVSTDADAVEDVEATILLPDGTTGYFETIADAINYAANYGTNSVIQLQKDLSGVEIDAKAGNAYSIDLNGHTIDNGSAMLIEDGAVVMITDSVLGASNEANELSVENRGTLTNGITITELLNLGITNNTGKVVAMTQQDSEFYEKSKFVNNGTVESANLEHGYFVENILEGAPAGLTGYHTIMNGNEYYVDFRDAVDIANASASDATILILSTVDNRNSTITIANQNGKAITVDLNGCNLSGGTLVTEGTVGFVNGRGSATCISEISAAIDNTGDLTIGAYVKVSGAVTNEEGGYTKVEEKAAISGPVDNKGSFENDGDITGIYTNEGDTKNGETGTMNNVIQKGGDFDNDGDIKTRIEMEGGSYTPSEGATPQVPDGAVAKSNTNPVTYYGTLKDAVDDANDPSVAGAGGQELPFTITILKDIPDEDLGETPIILDPDVPVDINLNNHKLGDEGTDKGIQIGENGSGTPSGDNTVTFTNEPENGEPADPAKGNVNTPIKVEDDGSLAVGKDTSLDDVDNDGKLKVEKDGNVEKLSNQGDTDNDGKLGDVEQNGGNLTNGEDGSIEELTQNGGDTENKGTIDKLTQNGGNTDNQGNIEEADLNGGGYTGTDPEIITGVDPDDETDGKVAMITPPGGGEPVYFVNLDDALEYAAGLDNGPVTVELLKDVTDENIDFTTTKNPTTPVILDLKGHDITAPSELHTGQGTNLTLTDSNPEDKGTISAPVVNDGKLTVEEGISITGNVKNTGDLDNKGTISGNVENTGDFDNAGDVTGDVAQKGGTYTNEEGATTNKITQTGGKTINKDNAEAAPGGIGTVDLQSGSYEGDEPANGIEGEAKIGNKIYGDLESAVKDANESDEDVTIELSKDVTLPDTPPLVIDNKNGHNIDIDLKGNDVTGGGIRIGTDEDEGGSMPSGSKVTIQDSGDPDTGEKGKVSSDIEVKKDGDLTLDESVTTDGDLNNAGKTTNDGTIKAPGIVTNTGDMDNNGDIETKVEQKEGTFTNGEDGKVKEVSQTGGRTENQNENGIENATVSGGEFTGEPATSMDYEGAKVAVVTKNPDGTTNTTYYPTLTEALEHTDGDATVKLLDDIKGGNGENIVIDKPGITLDLNSHEIGTPSSVTVTENATDTKLTDSSETKGGAVTAPLTNKGGLTIEEGTKATNVTNSGRLDNEGEITNLTNKGDTTNGGTIGTLKQEDGNVKNKEDGTIDTVDFDGGSYEGKQPETPISDAAAKIGDKLYGDLESAIEDANKAPGDVTIEVLKDTALPDASVQGTPAAEIGNENGKKITLDLGGNKVSGGPLVVKAPGTTEITDSDESGEGALQSDVEVNPDAKLVIDENTHVEGDINNNGTTENNGTVTGDVTNGEGGDFTNAGEIEGDVENDGDMENTGDISGNVKNDESGSFYNKGEDSYIGGEVDNAGDMDNEGVVSGEVDNTGDLHNRGNIDNNVVNRENGSLDNDGNVNGQLENKDNATTDNSGSINQVKQSGGELNNDAGGNIGEYLQSGGSLNNGKDGAIDNLNQSGGKSNNEGRIDEATVSDVKNYDGKLPESGLDNAQASVTYKDENGNTRTEYYPSLEEAIEAAGDKDTPATVTPTTTPVTIDRPVTIPEGVTLDIPADKEVVIAENGSLENQGDIHVGEDGSLKIEEGGSLENGGSLKNEGIIDNDGSLTNEDGGTLTNKGDIDNSGNLTNGEGGNVANTGDISNKGSGSLTNNGNIDNRNGSLNGDSDAEGGTVNNGNINGGEVNGPLENSETGKISGSDKLSGDITNKGKIEIYKDADTSGADIENLPGSSYVEKVHESGSSDSGNNQEDTTDTEDEELQEEETSEEETSDEKAFNDKKQNGNNAAAADDEDNREESENPDGTETVEEELLKEYIEQALQEGNITIAETGVMNTVIAEEEAAAVIEAVLTDSEKKAVFAGASLNLRAEISKIENEDVPEGYLQAVLDSVQDDKRAVSFLQLNLFKQVGDAAEEKVSTSAMVKVSFELPAEYRSVDGKPIAYEIVRVYTDEDGNICTESVAYSMEGDIITMYADNTSEYAILVAKDEVLAGDVYSGDNEGEAPLQLVKEPESRSWIWIIVLIATITVISLGAWYIFGRKRRNDSESDSV